MTKELSFVIGNAKLHNSCANILIIGIYIDQNNRKI